jgi:hypothetical protein
VAESCVRSGPDADKEGGKLSTKPVVERIWGGKLCRDWRSWTEVDLNLQKDSQRRSKISLKTLRNKQENEKFSDKMKILCLINNLVSRQGLAEIYWKSILQGEFHAKSNKNWLFSMLRFRTFLNGDKVRGKCRRSLEFIGEQIEKKVEKLKVSEVLSELERRRVWLTCLGSWKGIRKRVSMLWRIHRTLAKCKNSWKLNCLSSKIRISVRWTIQMHKFWKTYNTFKNLQNQELERHSNQQSSQDSIHFHNPTSTRPFFSSSSIRCYQTFNGHCMNSNYFPNRCVFVHWKHW